MRQTWDPWNLLAIILLLCGLVVIGTGCPTPTCCPLTVEGDVSSPMIAAATDQIHKTQPAAFVIWAGGEGDDQWLGSPQDVDVWNFVAVDNEGEEALAWWLVFDGAWTTTQMEFAPMGIEFMDISTIEMDLTDAWDAVLDAGYIPPFPGVEVFKALNPTIENPQFAFTLPDGGFVLVDTVTGEVTQERAGSPTRGLFECLSRCRSEYYACVGGCPADGPASDQCQMECQSGYAGCSSYCSDTEQEE